MAEFEKCLYSTENYMDCNNPELKQAKKELLKQGYSAVHRFAEKTWVVMVIILLPIALLKLLYYAPLMSFPVLICGGICGVLFADFMSGLVHWAADTWGNLDWPFVGPTFIRSFREHHISPSAMCHHDWVETNGDNFMLVVIPLILLVTKNYYENSVDKVTVPNWNLFMAMFWLTASVGVALTNQFHKWSHTMKPPAFVSLLQRYRIILPKSNHSLHHRPAFDGYYCITTGWLNPILDHPKVKFWRHAEYIVYKITGLIPREDDWKWTGLVNETPDVVKKYLEKKNVSQ